MRGREAELRNANFDGLPRAKRTRIRERFELKLLFNLQREAPVRILLQWQPNARRPRLINCHGDIARLHLSTFFQSEPLHLSGRRLRQAVVKLDRSRVFEGRDSRFHVILKTLDAFGVSCDAGS